MENENQNQPPQATQENNKMMIPAAIIVAGLIIAGAVIYVSGPRAVVPNGVNPPGDNAPPPSGNIAEILKVRKDDFVLGSPTAKVVFIEYGDFQCPFCGRFATQVKPQIVEQYVKTGKAAFAWRDFAFLGEESFRASEAARCAGEQEKFWDFHDYLFSHQQGENQGAFSDANLKKFAGAVKLDQQKFDSCFASGKYRKAVEDSAGEGRSIGVNGTPASFINGKMVGGAQPFAQFQAEIESALKK